MEDQLIDRRPPTPAAAKPTGCKTRVFKLLPAIAFLFLTVSAGHSIYRSWDDPSELAFVAFAYSDLVALFLCLNRFDGLGTEAAAAEERDRLRTAVWVLVTALELGFVWRVARVMPPALAFVVWVLAGSISAGGFYGLFVYREAEPEQQPEEKATARGESEWRCLGYGCEPGALGGWRCSPCSCCFV